MSYYLLFFNHVYRIIQAHFVCKKKKKNPKVNKHKLEAIIITRKRVAPIIGLNASLQLALKRPHYFHQDLFT